MLSNYSVSKSGVEKILESKSIMYSRVKSHNVSGNKYFSVKFYSEEEMSRACRVLNSLEYRNKFRKILDDRIQVSDLKILIVPYEC